MHIIILNFLYLWGDHLTPFVYASVLNPHTSTAYNLLLLNTSICRPLQILCIASKEQ